MEKIVTLGVITTKVAISFHKISSERSELDLISSGDIIYYSHIYYSQ